MIACIVDVSGLLVSTQQWNSPEGAALYIVHRALGVEETSVVAYCTFGICSCHFLLFVLAKIPSFQTGFLVRRQLLFSLIPVHRKAQTASRSHDFCEGTLRVALDSTAPAAFQAAGPRFPEPEQNLRYPRCDSTNTKFCYYNNYNLLQPRHFCKSCRRYWTKGGMLRNIPVGGGTRKNFKRSGSSSSSAAYSCKRPNPPRPPSHLSDLPKTEPISVLYPPLDPDRHLLDMTGSFSSLLASDGHLETFLESLHPVSGGDVTVLPNSTSAIRSGIHIQGMELQSSVSNSNTPAAAVENSERLEGAPGCWAASWTDVAIYNPGSNMQ
ncbi:unnamed protein product [Musa textilis]